MLPAQLPASTGTANQNPFLNAGNAHTADDLRKAIVQNPYTWDYGLGVDVIKFEADGKGKQTNFSFKWHAVNGQEIEIVAINANSGSQKARVKFSDDYSSYAGTDFGGVRALKGNILKPKNGDQAPATVASGTTSPLINTNQNTTDDLRKAILKAKYTWDHGNSSGKEFIKFAGNGTGAHSYFNFIWKIKSPQEIELSYADRNTPIKVVLKFSSDYSTYTGTDFDGTSPVTGHQVTASP